LLDAAMAGAKRTPTDVNSREAQDELRYGAKVACTAAADMLKHLP
jgi:hypothetical protein